MGEIVRYKRDVWGEEVILGVSWDLLWVVAVAVLVLLAAHAIVMAALAKKDLDRPTAEGRRVVRHESIDRIFHWLMAASIFVLIFTGTAPILGLRIAWLNIHWMLTLQKMTSSESKSENFHFYPKSRDDFNQKVFSQGNRVYKIWSKKPFLVFLNF